MDRTLTDPKAILDFVSVQSAIDFTATTDAERGELQERAVAAVTMAIQLEDQNTKALSDEALGIIATAVVGGMNAKDAALAGYQTLVSYFGSTGVPDQLPTTWANRGTTGKKKSNPDRPSSRRSPKSVEPNWCRFKTPPQPLTRPSWTRKKYTKPWAVSKVSNFFDASEMWQ